MSNKHLQILSDKRHTALPLGGKPGCFTSCFGLCKCVLERGAFTDVPKGSWWDRECEGLSCSIYLSIHQPHRHTHKNTGTSPSHAVQICYKTGWYLLDLLGVFVADKDNNWINVNTVEPLNGVRGDVEQTVTALHQKDIKITAIIDDRFHHQRSCLLLSTVRDQRATAVIAYLDQMQTVVSSCPIKSEEKEKHRIIPYLLFLL